MTFSSFIRVALTLGLLSLAASAGAERIKDLAGIDGIRNNQLVGYGLVVTPWGAYPGHTLEDVRSGIGVVHNTFLFDSPEKSVVKAPFVMNPKPPYFCDHRTVDKLARALVAFETAPSLFKIPKVALPGLRA